jgi:O-antigen ligase
MLLVVALLAVWVVEMVRCRQVRLVRSPVNLPLLLFVLSATVSLLAGNLLWNYFAEPASLAAQAGGWAVFILSAGAFMLVANLAVDLRWLKLMVSLFLGIGALFVTGRLLPPLEVVASWLMAPRVLNGALFWVWLVALAGGQALFNRSLTRPVRLVVAGLALATLAVSYFLGYGWKSGWLPGLVTLMALLWLRSWRLGLLVTAVGALGILLGSPDLPTMVVAGDQYSLFTRQVAWQIVLTQVFPLSPIVGLGPANYYHYAPLFPILGYHVEFSSHNQYVDILAQTGVVGMAIFLWLMAAMWRLGWRLRRQVRDSFARGYVCGCLAGLAGTLVAGMLADWFLPFVYNVGLGGFRVSVLGWLFLGGLVSLEQIYARRT